MSIVKTQKLSIEAQNLFVELVQIELKNYKKISLNMINCTIQHFGSLVPFNNVSQNYLMTLCHNKGIKAV